MQMQILKYVHIKIRKGSKEKSSDHSCLYTLIFDKKKYNKDKFNPRHKLCI